MKYLNYFQGMDLSYFLSEGYILLASAELVKKKFRFYQHIKTATPQGIPNILF